jgi:hypothetical protein
MAAVERQEPLLVRQLEAIVELLAEPRAQLGPGSNPGNVSRSIRYIRSTLSMSARIDSATPGYCTFTTTSRPSCVRAACTWPIDAAASGSGSNDANARSGGSPRSSVTTCAASSYAIGGAPSSNVASAARYGWGSPASTYDAICASFMAAPFISPMVAATSSAVRMW